LHPPVSVGNGRRPAELYLRTYCVTRSAAVSQPDPQFHADPKTPPDHELTPLESYFDDLFNHHMVLPQSPEEGPPIEGVQGPEPASDDRHGG